MFPFEGPSLLLSSSENGKDYPPVPLRASAAANTGLMWQGSVCWGAQQMPEVMQRSSLELRGENRQNDLSAVKVNGSGSVWVWNGRGREGWVRSCPGETGRLKEVWFLSLILCMCVTHLWHAHPLASLLSLLPCPSQLPCSPVEMGWMGEPSTNSLFSDWWRSLTWQCRNFCPAAQQVWFPEAFATWEGCHTLKSGS